MEDGATSENTKINVCVHRVSWHMRRWQEVREDICATATVLLRERGTNTWAYPGAGNQYSLPLNLSVCLSR